MHTDVDIAVNLQPLSLLLSRFGKLQKPKYFVLGRSHRQGLSIYFPIDLTFGGQSQALMALISLMVKAQAPLG